MALKFDGVADRATIPIGQYIGGAAEVVVSYWIWWDGFANNDDMIMEYTVDVNSNAGWYVDPNAADGTFGWAIGTGAAAYTRKYTRTNVLAAATWTHHYMRMAHAPTQSYDLWVNGVYTAQTSSGGTIPATSTRFANGQLHLMHRFGPTLFGAGKIAELAIWTGFSGTQYPDAFQLYSGVSPLQINPRNLVGYWPMRGGDLNNYARTGVIPIQRIVGQATAPDDIPSNVTSVYMYTSAIIGDAITGVDAATVYVDITASGSEVRAAVDTVTAYVDIQPSGLDGVTHFDAATTLMDIQVHFCEFYIPGAPSEFIWSEHTKWSMEPYTKWSEIGRTRWQWEVRVPVTVAEEICF